MWQALAGNKKLCHRGRDNIVKQLREGPFSPKPDILRNRILMTFNDSLAVMGAVSRCKCLKA